MRSRGRFRALGRHGVHTSLLALYRGILPPILVETPKRAIKFSANEQYGTLYGTYLTNDGKMTHGYAVDACRALALAALERAVAPQSARTPARGLRCDRCLLPSPALPGCRS